MRPMVGFNASGDTPQSLEHGGARPVPGNRGPAGRSDRKEHTVVNGMRQQRDHVDLSLPETADRLAIRELIDAYAYCADRRDVAGQLALFTEDTELVVFADSRNPEPTQRFRGRAALVPVFDELKNYRATMHFNGQSRTRVNGARASAVTYCLVHELAVDDTAHTRMIAALRYLDSLVKKDGKWFIRQRQVAVDWIETRPLATG
jgi:SnoaL-like domain